MLFSESISADTWRTVAEACAWATFFHTPEWAAAIAAVRPEYDARAFGCELGDGTVAVVPAVVRKKRRLIGSRLELKSMEPGVYGGIIAGRELTAEEVQTIAGGLAKLGSGRLTQSPFGRVALPDSFAGKTLTTHVVDLAADYEAVRKAFNRGQKSNLNQARKKGVTVRRGHADGDIEAYWRIYQQTLARWGDETLARYPRELFQGLFALGVGQVQYWLAEVEGTAVAGALVLAWNRNLVYWHGCALDDYFKWYPNNLLQAAVMQWGCENGFEYYDLGASMGMEGVSRFKRSFGAREVEYLSYRWK